MKADRFLRAFGVAISQMKPTGGGTWRAWTGEISKVLDQVGNDQNLWVCHKNGTSCRGELWGMMDYAFCKNTVN